jgi:hypothetical protein
VEPGVFGRVFGAPRQKPGYPLQSFLPQTAKKDFRSYPSRGRPQQRFQSRPAAISPSVFVKRRDFPLSVTSAHQPVDNLWIKYFFAR